MLIQVILAGLLLSIPPSSKCGNFDDNDKRSFYGLDPVVKDIDGDGQPDTIIPRLVVPHFRDRKSKLHRAESIGYQVS
jgi:hypothetical protein